MVTFKDWVEIFNALLTPLIAVLAAYIAWQQYRVNHHSLRNQLYERRYAVFKAFMSYLADIMREGKTNYQRIGQFYAEASEAEFLFSESISKKMEELYSKGVDLVALHERMYPSDGSPGLPVGDERSKVAKEAGELLNWFYRQIKTTKEIFKSEMKVG
jgi:hypothetical protein